MEKKNGGKIKKKISTGISLQKHESKKWGCFEISSR
jgi:hypothetical protein